MRRLRESDHGKVNGLTDYANSRARFAGCRRIDPGDSILLLKVPPEGVGHALARGLLEMQLLRLQTRRSWLNTFHEGQSHIMQKGLSEVI